MDFKTPGRIYCARKATFRLFLKNEFTTSKLVRGLQLLKLQTKFKDTPISLPDKSLSMIIVQFLMLP